MSFETPRCSIRGCVLRLTNGSPARGVSRVIGGFGGAGRRRRRAGAFAGRIAARLPSTLEARVVALAAQARRCRVVQNCVTSIPGVEQIAEPRNDIA